MSRDNDDSEQKEIMHELTSHNSYKLFDSDGELIAEFYKGDEETQQQFKTRISNYKVQLANGFSES